VRSTRVSPVSSQPFAQGHGGGEGRRSRDSNSRPASISRRVDAGVGVGMFRAASSASHAAARRGGALPARRSRCTWHAGPGRGSPALALLQQAAEHPSLRCAQTGIACESDAPHAYVACAIVGSIGTARRSFSGRLVYVRFTVPKRVSMRTPPAQIARPRPPAARVRTRAVARANAWLTRAPCRARRARRVRASQKACVGPGGPTHVLPAGAPGEAR
jgi:hypothetical protein